MIAVNPDARCPFCAARTLTESCEFGAAECRTAFVYLRLACAECGFVHEFRHEERLRVGADGTNGEGG